LGRRIRKIDSVASKTTLYYNNPDWQVLEEYDSGGSFMSLHTYGNYIDEVLYSYTMSFGQYYYVHDHLYSPAALVDTSTGAALERYEYDAYGKATIPDTAR